MPRLLLKNSMLSLLITTCAYTSAQKNIVISESLVANSQQLSVKMGTQGFGKMWKIRFGEYGVVSSKAGWITTNTKGNIFGTHSESNAKEKFSFTMTNNANDTAVVNAETYTMTKASHELALSSHFSFGSSQIEQWKENFTALLTVNGDTTNTWTLLMNGEANRDSADRFEAYLLSSNRKILLVPVTSNKNNGDKRMWPALGYEFIDEGRPICAVQYFGGGLSAMTRNFVWIDRRLDTKTQFILSVAATAILKLKVSQLLDR